MSRLSLAETQGRLKDYLLDAGNRQAPVLPMLAGDFGLSREKRLNIYHNAYRARLIEALETVYERTWVYLGDQDFYQVSTAYIEASPSAERNLRNYGADFPDYLKHHQTEDPEAAELAQMDWNLHIAFDAPNVTHLSPAILGELDEADWDVAGFAFQPGLSLAVFDWNTVDIWHAIDQQQTPPPAQGFDAPVAYVFWRHGQKSNFRSLSPPEYQMLDDLRTGKSFAETCESVSTAYPEASEQSGPWLYRWLLDEMICGITGRSLAGNSLTP